MTTVEEGEVRRAAVADEMQRFNAAIKGGKAAILSTTSGYFFVQFVDAKWQYYCSGTPAEKDPLHYHLFAGANDEQWQSLMSQVGEPRHSLFAADGQEQVRTVHGAGLAFYQRLLERFLLSSDFPVYVRKAGQQNRLRREPCIYLTLYPNGTWAGLTEEQRDGGYSSLELLLWEPEEPHLNALKEYLRERLKDLFSVMTSDRQKMDTKPPCNY